MANNKIIYGSNTLIDLTSDTVTADKLAEGYTAHDKAGNLITGTMSGGIEGIPIEISTDAGMEAVLTSENIGKVYKFTGTSDTYTNGDLYIVEVG